MNQHSESSSDHGPPSTAVPVDAAIFSRDGTQIGSVKEVREDRFLVAVPMAFDYWLSTRCIATVQDGQVVLGVDIGAVAEYLVDEEGQALG